VVTPLEEIKRASDIFGLDFSFMTTIAKIESGWIAWKSMCATNEGRQKGEKWCKRAIWQNTLTPASWPARLIGGIH
jgi:hypothetical protein